MDKTRYQVFVSSTYADLVAERSAIFDAVTQIDCIPAGMETFPAFDGAQLDYIKRIIDDSDYYILVIGGRYGSLSEKNLSFTEEEYEYALSKGIPILSFIHSQPESIPVGKTDQDSEKADLLRKFIEKAKKGRIIKSWSNTDELTLRVTQALSQTIKSKPGIGWVRGDNIARKDILEELNEVLRENTTLRLEIEHLKTSAGTKVSLDLIPLSSYQTLRFRYKKSYDDQVRTSNIDVTWNDIFKIVGPAFHVPHFPSSIVKSFKTHLTEMRGWNYVFIEMVHEDMNVVVAQFSALGLMGRSQSSDGKIVLTTNGEQKLLELLAVKNNSGD